MVCFAAAGWLCVASPVVIPGTQVAMTPFHESVSKT
jgi:hypothetical protein